MKCVFGCKEAAYKLFYMDQGCVALRNTKIQPLCVQHTVNATPIGSMIDITPWQTTKVE